MPPVNFGSPIGQVTGTAQVQQTIPVVRETLTATRIGSGRETRTTDVGKDPTTWTANDLCYYVVRQIETLFGDFPKDMKRITGIFNSFHSRHKELAGPIAVAAFEVFNGKWRGSRISVNRFCKASDAYFAEPIKARLTA